MGTRPFQLGGEAQASPEAVGNKAYYLSIIKAQGFPVPDGFVIGPEAWQQVLDAHHAQAQVSELLALGLGAQATSRKLASLMAGFAATEPLAALIGAGLSLSAPDGIPHAYAVRSSSSLEDLPGSSFAGQYQTYLGVSGLAAIQAAVLDCYRSQYSEQALAYMANLGIDQSRMQMSVLVQRMVDADVSGVAFTLDPVSGNDHEMVIEYAPGLGEAFVSGHAQPSSCRYDWLHGRYTQPPATSLLSASQLDCLTQTVHQIQLHLGFPLDIEFAFAGDALSILQARPITGMAYAGLDDIWTTADFKDGGVSATVCTPFMWSLYEYAWEHSLLSFLAESRLLSPAQLRRLAPPAAAAPPLAPPAAAPPTDRHPAAQRKLGGMFYGRPYWNLSVVKEAMSVLPGFREREFDEEFGIKPSYPGDGFIRTASAWALARAIPVIIAINRMATERRRQAEGLKSKLLATYQACLDGLGESRGTSEWLTALRWLVEHDYLGSEGAYFRQIFLNTVHQPLFKSAIAKHVNEGEYLDLIGGLSQVSHILPSVALWQLADEIKADPDGLAFWQACQPERLTAGSLDDDRHQMPRLKAFIDRFGYHSDKELDVTYPHYAEQPAAVAAKLIEALRADPAHDPRPGAERQRRAVAERLQSIKARLGARSFRRLERQVSQMRQMLWWREEFRDVSTRFYYLIRLYSLRLAERLAQDGTLRDQSDIWFVEVGDLWRLSDMGISPGELQAIADKNRDYYQCYRNYLSPNEIGPHQAFAPRERAPIGEGARLRGVACGGGEVTGTARVVAGLEDIGRLGPGDILVARYTDTGWTSRFAMLKGIVTEYGGVLCHAAVVSREYGLPCVVGVDGLLLGIRDGDLISVDGSAGVVKVLEARVAS
jgi:pyruvate,water dikinase